MTNHPIAEQLRNLASHLHVAESVSLCRGAADTVESLAHDNAEILKALFDFQGRLSCGHAGNFGLFEAVDGALQTECVMCRAERAEKERDALQTALATEQQRRKSAESTAHTYKGFWKAVCDQLPYINGEILTAEDRAAAWVNRAKTAEAELKADQRSTYAQELIATSRELPQIDGVSLRTSDRARAWVERAKKAEADVLRLTSSRETYIKLWLNICGKLPAVNGKVELAVERAAAWVAKAKEAEKLLDDAAVRTVNAENRTKRAEEKIDQLNEVIADDAKRRTDIIEMFLNVGKELPTDDPSQTVAERARCWVARARKAEELIAGKAGQWRLVDPVDYDKLVTDAKKLHSLREWMHGEKTVTDYALANHRRNQVWVTADSTGLEVRSNLLGALLDRTAQS